MKIETAYDVQQKMKKKSKFIWDWFLILYYCTYYEYKRSHYDWTSCSQTNCSINSHLRDQIRRNSNTNWGLKSYDERKRWNRNRSSTSWSIKTTLFSQYSWSISFDNCDKSKNHNTWWANSRLLGRMSFSSLNSGLCSQTKKNKSCVFQLKRIKDWTLTIADGSNNISARNRSLAWNIICGQNVEKNDKGLTPSAVP